MNTQTESQARRQGVPLSVEVERKVKESVDWLLQKLEGLKKPLSDVYSSNENERGKLGKTQFQNILRATGNSAGIPELALFIKYQMGRARRNEGWAFVVQQPNTLFGEKVIEVLEAIHAKSSEMAPEWTEQEKRQLSLKLTERFFTYLIWHVSYLDQKPSQQRNNRYHSKGGNRR